MAAATYDLTTSTYGAGNYALSAQEAGFLKTTVARYIDTTSSGNVGAMVAGSYKLFTIPAGAFVTRVSIAVSVGETNPTIAVGNSTTANKFLTAAVNTAGADKTSTAVAYHSTADEIQCTIAVETMNESKFWVIVDYHVLNTSL